MRFKKSVLLTALVPMLALASQAAAYCLAPPTPPPWNRQWILSASNPSDATSQDPGNGECDSYVINARNVETIEVEVTDPASTPEKCVGTTLNVRHYLQNTDGTWSYEGVSSVTGVWTYQGCRLPSSSWTPHTTRDARVHITTKRTYASGQFSVLQYGLPFDANATVFYNPGPS